MPKIAFFLILIKPLARWTRERERVGKRPRGRKRENINYL